MCVHSTNSIVQSFVSQVFVVICCTPDTHCFIFVISGNFCTAIGEGYKSTNPYHNACHGADVMNSVHYILDYAGLRRSRGLKYNHLSSSEFFGALLAALIHDFKVSQY